MLLDLSVQVAVGMKVAHRHLDPYGEHGEIWTHSRNAEPKCCHSLNAH